MYDTRYGTSKLMCLCDPRVRTPWCGKPGCQRPERATIRTSNFTQFKKKVRFNLHVIVEEKETTIPCVIDIRELSKIALDIEGIICKYVEST